MHPRMSSLAASASSSSHFCCRASAALSRRPAPVWGGRPCFDAPASDFSDGRHYFSSDDLSRTRFAVRRRAEFWEEKRRTRDSYLRTARNGKEWGETDPAVVEIRRLGGQTRWEAALATFATAWAEDPRPRVLVATMQACARSLQVAQAQRLFDSMPLKTLSAYSVLLHTLGSVGNLSAMDALLEDMRQQAVQPDREIYRVLIEVHGRTHDLPRAMKSFEDMEAAGFPATAAVYQSMLSALARAGDREGARRLLARMEANGLRPDPGHLTSLIVACTVKQDEVEARKVFEDIRQRGMQPDVVSYTALIGCYSGNGAVQKAEATWAEMQAAGVKVDSFTYNGMLKVMARAGASDRFRELLAEMDKRGIARNRETELRLREFESLEAARHEDNAELCEEPALPPGWASALDPGSRQHYFWRESDPSGTTTWERPLA